LLNIKRFYKKKMHRQNDFSLSGVLYNLYLFTYIYIHTYLTLFKEEFNPHGYLFHWDIPADLAFRNNLLYTSAGDTQTISCRPEWISWVIRFLHLHFFFFCSSIYDFFMICFLLKWFCCFIHLYWKIVKNNVFYWCL
jgi:hypothetical protein